MPHASDICLVFHLVRTSQGLDPQSSKGLGDVIEILM